MKLLSDVLDYAKFLRLLMNFLFSLDQYILYFILKTIKESFQLILAWVKLSNKENEKFISLVLTYKIIHSLKKQFSQNEKMTLVRISGLNYLYYIKYVSTEKIFHLVCIALRLSTM